MRFDRPDSIAAVIAALLGVLTGIITYAGFAFGGYEPPWVIILAEMAVVFLATFIITRFAVYRFVYEKVKLIYKSIHDKKPSTDQEEDQIARSSTLSEVEREVSEWAEERQTEIAELREREAFRREFIGNVSHELKTPIFNIQGYILTLLDGGMNDPEINAKYLERANRSVERMISLIQDMDVLTKLESGVMDVRKESFEIVPVIREVFEMMESRAKKKGIALRIKKDHDKSARVEGDPQRIEQVLSNLVSNAIKYGREGGYVEVGIYDMDKKFLVEVADNGQGIPENDISRIFERFYRVDKSRARHIGGSGLGLAIVKHIVDAHKQTLNVRSKEGTGSTFSFTLKKGKQISR